MAKIAEQEKQMQKQDQQILNHKNNEKYLSKQIKQMRQDEARENNEQAKDIAKKVETERKRRMVMKLFGNMVYNIVACPIPAHAHVTHTRYRPPIKRVNATKKRR